MAITDEANTIALSSVIASTLDTLAVISLSDSNGEYFRKVPTNVEIISPSKKRFTFWLSETEGNGNIIRLAIWGAGATTTPGSGTEMVYEDFADPISKTNLDSLTIEWLVEVK